MNITMITNHGIVVILLQCSKYPPEYFAQIYCYYREKHFNYQSCKNLFSSNMIQKISMPFQQF